MILKNLSSKESHLQNLGTFFPQYNYVHFVLFKHHKILHHMQVCRFVALKALAAALCQRIHVRGDHGFKPVLGNVLP
jgi:hypothetical protein